jgi:ribosomal protein S18 acetylase RimI-like enzyme
VSSDRLSVRKARPDDLAAVKEMADANRRSLGFVLRPALVVGIEKGWMIVAELPRWGIVGFLHYRHRRDSQTTLYELCVMDAHRRDGVGGALVHALVEESVACGKSVVCLKTPSGSPANEFYKAIGFQLLGTVPGRGRSLNLWCLSGSPSDRHI